jgi:hypothetical protein
MLNRYLPFIFTFVILLSSMAIPHKLVSQDGGSFFGAFNSNANFFIRDENIGAVDIPQYDNQKFGADAWLNLNYNYKKVKVGMRYDLFNNSNLFDPNGSYTDQGIGMYFAEIDLGKLDLRVGHIYDQIGSGIIFRAYELRPLLFDNALFGARLRYRINDNWTIKGFTGKQKFLFDTFDAVVKGGSLDGFMQLGSEENPINLIPGIGVFSRTNSDETIQKLVSALQSYTEPSERINGIAYNNYLASIYNTVSYGNLSWYAEVAYKSPDVFLDPFETVTTFTGAKVPGRYVRESGTVFYTTLSYAVKKIGITIEAKRTENFNFRTDQTLILTRGIVNFLPPMMRQNTYRLTSRYSPATQDVSEQAIQVDLRYNFTKKFTGLTNFSYIETLGGETLYREIYSQLQYKASRKLKVTGGVQMQLYNQAIYEGKPSNVTPNVQTVTPFMDLLYKFTRKKSLRVEAQYMSTEQDYGSWIFGLAELGLAPHWQFEVSGMYNLVPSVDNPNIPAEVRGKQIFYPTFGGVYSEGANRYSLRYVKQVEGVVCSGGVCRLEPAFSGVKFEVTSTF